ncbi:MAG: pirin-like bicupin family protein [Acidimicrobiales bacterium]
MSTTDIRRSDQRFATRAGWLDSRHSFSFGPHRDPANQYFGVLLVNNDDRVAAGTGFETHPHRDMEIVTWVLDGELEHKDSQGNRGIIYPGLAQRMTAGTGIWHSEKNLSTENDVHFVQMWVVPDTERVDPGYQQLDINVELSRGGLVPVASGRGHEAAIAVRQRGAVLWAGRLAAEETLSLPDAPYVHLFVARGSAGLDETPLVAGDSARLTGAGGPRLTAGAEGAEVLVWEMDATLQFG